LNRMQHILAFPAYIKHYLFNRDMSESVYFYTFHKCASTLFSEYILKNIEDLKHVDYASQIYSGSMAIDKQLVFKEKGCIYGPIRLSADPMSPVYKMLIKPTSEHKFIQDKISIFFVRDPRDILVSSYYSFGYTHGFSSVKAIRERQEAIRNTIQMRSLDKYVLESADVQVTNFKTLNELANVCKRRIILKYEDMVNDFESFITQLCKYVVIEENVIQEIYQRSRPKHKEDTLSHRRSGQAGGFRSKLKEKTIECLNSRLEETLTIFKYEA
jgi:hypothetical protein